MKGPGAKGMEKGLKGGSDVPPGGWPYDPRLPPGPVRGWPPAPMPNPHGVIMTGDPWTCGRCGGTGILTDGIGKLWACGDCQSQGAGGYGVGETPGSHGEVLIGYPGTMVHGVEIFPSPAPSPAPPSGGPMYLQTKEEGGACAVY